MKHWIFPNGGQREVHGKSVQTRSTEKADLKSQWQTLPSFNQLQQQFDGTKLRHGPWNWRPLAEGVSFFLIGIWKLTVYKSTLCLFSAQWEGPK